jgi:hypothetical protein
MWRPMAFGRRPARTILNPVLEPLWPGRRVLVRVERGRPTVAPVASAPPPAVEIRDDDGLELAGHPDLQLALAEAAGADALVIDGYLLELPRRDAPLASAAGVAAVAPGLGDTTRQLVLGRRAAPGRPEADHHRRGSALDGRRDGAASLAAQPRRDSQTVAALVAVDLLAIDAESLLDAPLVERKRLLDAVLTVGERIRRGPHTWPPAESWYGQWRALGFREFAVKAANSRYRPGQPSDDWAVALIPRG